MSTPRQIHIVGGISLEPAATVFETVARHLGALVKSHADPSLIWPPTSAQIMPRTRHDRAATD
ncbi:MAG TPA: hypothetical protein VJR47_05545 [Stellaceae bacterium]|nr:hypothetical protein [Stellaceae bacterium]